jgi:hypothetical protein
VSKIAARGGGGGVSVTVTITPELRERIERGALRAAAIRWPGKRLVIEWDDADTTGIIPTASRDENRGLDAA